MTTPEIKAAFESLISERGVHHKLGLSSEQVRNYRARLKRGESIMDSTMLDVLNRAGKLTLKED